eukprot:gnl/MRDRNA2_/MRDRNA2_84927_c5_seq1.p1 gnl/MRDRNA2_/MRDRNA2_84927_c5~~gnl/MRDRNA2_/MRDRNA2_84927_c5_seq1.p1  ORF type:complete len:108 (+),score=25.32 gnl/MRDRNA2_/MRDRNA2_84927_c5_seq1:328-651(+)
MLDAELSTAYARVVKKRTHDIPITCLVTTAWAFARMGNLNVHHEELFMALATLVKQRVSDLESEKVFLTAWSFAKAEQFDKELFRVLARATCQLKDCLKLQEISQTV